MVNTRTRLYLLAVVTITCTLAVAGASFADIVTNTIDIRTDTEGDYWDPEREALELVVGGAAKDVTFRVIAESREADGDPACNFEDNGTGDRLETSINSSNPEVANLNRSSITFNECGVAGDRSLTVTPSDAMAGTSNISLGQEFNNTDGGFDLLPARFAVRVQHRTNLDVDITTGTYGDSADLKATLSSPTSSVGNGSVANKEVAFTLNGMNAGTRTTNASGVARLTDVSLTNANGARIVAGTYAGGVGASFAGTNTHRQSEGSNDLIVQKANQTISFGALANKTYGDAPFEVSATSSSGFRVILAAKAGSDCNVSPSTLREDGTSVSTVTISGAGGCTVVSSRPETPNYNMAQAVEQSFSVARAPLTVKADNGSREYGANNPTLTGTLTGVKNGDRITASYGTVANVSSDVGSHPIVATLNDPDGKLSNYEVHKADGTLTVTQAPLVLKAHDTSREYGDANPAFSGEIVSGAIKNNDDVSLSFNTQAAPGVDVGTYPIVTALSGAKATNYAVSSRNGTLTVTRAPLAVKADNSAREYGEANPTFTGTLSGVKLDGPIGASFSAQATASSSVGSYPIVLAGLDGAKASNYEVVSEEDGTLTVTQAPLAVKATDTARAYGDANPPFEVIYSGFKNGEDERVLGGALGFQTTATVSSPVGTYPTDPSGLTSENYAISFTGGTLTVNQAPLTVEVDDKERTYGDPNPNLTGTVTGVKNNDNITAGYHSSAASSSPVGEYSISATLADPGGRVGNYEVTLFDGKLTINRASLAIVANDASRHYGDSDPEFTGTVTGVRNGDNITASYGTAATSSSKAGDYAIVPTPVDPNNRLGNYAVTLTNGKLTVLSLTLNGFYKPVDMGIKNYAKSGAAIPLKFEIFKDGVELTDTNVVETFAQKINCVSGAGDDIEQYATGGTSLRYDATGGQFVFNWQAPKVAGSCYRVTMTAKDGSSLQADFSLK